VAYAGTVYIEAAMGADLTADPATWTWTDLSSRARGQVQVVGRGRPNLGSGQPTSGVVRLANNDGWLTPWYPSSPWYGTWTRGTPVRVRLDPGTGPVVRLQGYASAIKPTWPAGNSDNAEVFVTVTGALGRPGQGTALRSAMYRNLIGLTSGQVGYWSLEDGSNATQAGSAQPSGVPMLSTGTVRFGAAGPAGGGTGVDLTSGTLYASVPNTSGTVPPLHQINVAFQHASLSGGSADIVDWALAGSQQWAVVLQPAGSGGLTVSWATGGVTTVYASNVAVDDGLWHHLSVIITSALGVSSLAVYLDGVLVISQSGIVGNVGLDTIKIANATFGHLAAWRKSVPAAGLATTYSAFTGWAGELASARVSRLCGEENMPVTVTGTSTTAMGPQTAQSLVALLRECESTDQGVLRDGLTAGVTYLAGPSRYNQAVTLALDTLRRHIKWAGPGDFEPIDDDSRDRNDITATRASGSSARYVNADPADPLGTVRHGTYDDTPAVNPSTDAALLQQAGWRVHQGTIREMRVPSLTIQPFDTTELIASWLACDLGSRYTAAHMPTQYPGDLDQVLEYYTETFDAIFWAASLTGSPAQAWRVWVLDDATLGHLDFEGQNLAAGVTATATSWSIATPAGIPLITTSVGDMPIDLNVEGEQVRITAVSGAASPQTATVTRSVNGVVKSHVSGTVISAWAPVALSL
jgi:hypothetical protein